MSNVEAQTIETTPVPPIGGDVELRWVKPPQQERSQNTHDRLIEAAERLIAGGRTWSDIGVAELVKEAGSSVGAFYNRFRDKDSLLHMLQIALYRQGEATAADARALAAFAVPLDRLIHAFVSLAVTVYRQQRGIRRALMEQMFEDRSFRQRAVALSRLTCEVLTAALADRYPAHDAATLRTAVDVAHRMLYGLLDQNLMFEDAPTDNVLADGTLIEELALAITVYLERKLA